MGIEFKEINNKQTYSVFEVIIDGILVCILLGYEVEGKDYYNLTFLHEGFSSGGAGGFDNAAKDLRAVGYIAPGKGIKVDRRYSYDSEAAEI
jgi:hypothetical protein